MSLAGIAAWALVWSLGQVPASAIYSSHAASWCNVGQQHRCDGNWHFLEREPAYSTDFLFTGNNALDLSYGFCDQWKPSYVIAFTDWDLDRDLDVVAVDQDGHGVFVERFRGGIVSTLPQQLGGLAVSAPDFGSHSGLGDTTLHAVDWDGDGRTDLIVSKRNETHHWSRLFKRTGNLTLEEQVGAMGLFENIVYESWGSYRQAEFLDWDGDGDIDVVFWDGQHFRFFERSTGDTLIEHKAARNPLKGLSINVDSSNSFRITDWDGDGDQDFFMFGFGAQYARGSDATACTIHYVEQLADGSFVLHNDGGPLADMYPHSSCGQRPWKLEFVDWNLDGLVDMWFGPDLYIRKQDESYVHQEGRSDPFSQLRFGYRSEPYYVDWDSDGDVDIIVAQQSYWEPNVSLVLLEHDRDGTFRRRPLELEGLKNGDRLGLGHWDRNGYMNLVYTEFSSGRIRFFEFVGDALVERTGIENPFAGINVTVGPNASQEMRLCFLYAGSEWGYQDCLTQPIEPILADWDGDGDLDLMLAPPSRRYFERMPNGSLEERFGSQNPWPEDLGQGHALDTDSEADQMRHFRWTVADADGDGDMDILYVLASWNTGHAFVRTGVCLQLSPEHVQCQPSRSGPPSAGGYGYRFADLDSDGDLDLLSMSSTYDYGSEQSKLEYWRRSLCRPSQPCSGNGVCAPLSSRCSCGEGYDNSDCSACAKDFYTAHSQDGVIRVCVRCATDKFSSPKAEVCSGRGRCFDDFTARSEAGPLTKGTFTGTGSCHCSNRHFNGTDISGRSHCGDGICPDGSIEALERNLRIIGLEVGSPVRTCSKCLPGSASTGGQECDPCSPGKFTADHGSDSCLPCPEGTHVAESGALGCTLCPLGRWAGNGSVGCKRCDAGWVPGANGSTCDKCPAGKAVLDKEAITCSVCPAGTFSWGGSVVCKSCPAGSFSKQDSAKCVACPEGHKSDPTATVCVPCQAGSWAAAGSPVCHPCSADSVSEAQSSQCFPCTSTFYHRVPGSARHVCHPDPNSLAGSAAMLVCLFLAGLSLLLTFFHSVPIADVSLDQGALILTTWGPHRVLRWKWATPTVYLVGTSVPWLDNPGDTGLYRVKARDATTLVLLHPEGQVGPWGTSMGTLFVAPTCAWRYVGYLRVPCTVWFCLFLAGVFASTMAMPLYSAGGEAVFASFSVFVWWLRQRRQINKTPLARQRTKFLKRLRRNNPRPVRTQRGPQRAISAGQLCEFHEHFQGFIKERSTYYICPNLVRPLTTEDRCSYAELAGPGQVRWFVSHYWGTGFRHFVFTVRNHARAFCGDEPWESQRYWICTFSNNQWDIGAELGDGQWQQSSFYLALRDSNCGGTAMVLDEEAMPLTRAWCLFEVVQTLLLSQQSSSFTGLALCSESGVLNHGSAGTDVCIAVAGRLATMDLRNAQASDEGDLQRIFALVNSMPGGFDAVNGFVRSSIRDALLAVRGRFERDFAQLSGKLASANCKPSPADAKLVRALTSVAGDSADSPAQDRVPGPRLLGALQNMQAQAKGDQECDEEDVELGRGCKVCV